MSFLLELPIFRGELLNFRGVPSDFSPKLPIFVGSKTDSKGAAVEPPAGSKPPRGRRLRASMETNINKITWDGQIKMANESKASEIWDCLWLMVGKG